MAANITVKYHRNKIETNLQSYDLRVVADSATDMPKKIFIMQREAAPAPNSNDTPEDRFVCIADPVDLEEFPADVPALDDNMPYYRTDDVTLRFRSVDTLEATKNDIASDIQGLVDSLKAADDVELSEEITYA